MGSFKWVEGPLLLAARWRVTGEHAGHFASLKEHKTATAIAIVVLIERIVVIVT